MFNYKNNNQTYCIKIIFFGLLMLFNTHTFAVVNTINVSMTNGVTGDIYSHNLTFKQKQQYTKKNGKIHYKWVRVKSQKTDPLGQVQFQYPSNIDSIDEQGHVFLNQFKLATKSPITEKTFNSDHFTNTTKQFVFKVGANPFTVTLSNSITDELITEQAVSAWLVDQQGNSRRIGRQKTNQLGEAIFELPEIGIRQYFFKSRPYRLRVSSETISSGNQFDFKVGSTAIAVMDEESQQYLANIKLVAYEVLADSSLKRYAAVKSNDQGIAYFDLPQLGEKQYVFEARAPFGKNNLGKNIHFDYSEQPTISQPGYSELRVTKRDTSGGGNGDGTKTPTEISHYLNRISFGVTPELLAYVNEIGLDAYVEQQLNPQTIDDSLLRSHVDGWIEAPGNTEKGVFINNNHLSYYTLYQAMYSQRQLQEVMTQFWENHFNTDSSKTKGYADEARENDLFRQHALGKFRDILAVSAHSPMMLKYLDNAASKKALPNENYAREIMELHTLGVYGGYTEEDVVALSKVFTGWTYQGEKGNRTFYFKARDHDESDKIFLGYEILSNGQQEGELVLDILARDPATAQFICTKLAQVFITDSPSVSLVQSCTTIFANTDGDIKEVVKSLINSSEFNNLSNFHIKLKTPLEFVVGLNRAFGFENQHPSGLDTLKPDINGRLNSALSTMGMPLYQMPAPTGYDEIAKKWVSSAQLKARIRYQNSLLLSRHFNTIAWVKQQGLNNAEEIVDYLLNILLANDYQAQEKAIALNILTENGQYVFDPNAADETNLRSHEMNLLRMTMSTIASFPSHQLQ